MHVQECALRGGNCLSAIFTSSNDFVNLIYPQGLRKNGGSLSAATIACVTINFDYTQTLLGLLTAACAVVEGLDIPHLAVVGRVHDEVAHIRTGCR